MALAALAPAAGAFANQSDTSDQTDVAVTVYNNNLALVRDTRTLTLPTGEIDLRFMGVAEQIQPQTVALKSLSEPGALHILEQNYEYDLMSPQKLMEKYVGRSVRLVNMDNDMAFSVVDATLLSLNNGPVYEIDGDIHLGHPGNVVLPEVPEELIAEPTLVWKLQNRADKHNVEATYLTGGMSWQADYVLTYDEAKALLDLEGWVTLNNNSGATYNNATLKVVAGDVNRAPQGGFGGGGGGFGAQLEALGYMADASMQQESFAEYHLYTLPRRTTIKQNQSKQVNLMNATGVKVEKKYEYRGQLHFYSQPMGTMPEENAGTFLVFQNEEENELGVPLPGGVMRVYQQDQSGMLQFAGEDRIDHTAKDEEVRLRLGSAFDLVCERKQTDYKALPGNAHEAAFEITLRNHKETDVVIDVVEPMPGDWTVLAQSQDYEKRDAQTAIFSVPVPADGEAVVTYRVRVRF
jgi:hypothetical protein